MKKRLFAILLVVALVFSSVAALVACNNETEYEISFRKNGSVIFKLTTSGGKLTKAQVDEATNKNIAKIDNRQHEGYYFVGWYTDVDGDVLTGEINYAKKYTENASYEAGYEFAPLAGEDEGYTLIGVINGVENWGANGLLTEETWKMTQDEEEGWIYRITTDIKGRDSIKVKTFGKTWGEGKINLGAPGLSEVTFEDGVQPEDVDPIGDANDGTSVIWGNLQGSNDLDNTYVSKHVETANVTITFNYRTKTYDIHFNSLTWLEEVPEPEYILVGGPALAGESPDDTWSAETSTQGRFFVRSEGDDNIRTLDFEFTGVTSFKVKENGSDWGWQIGWSSAMEVTYDDAVSAEDKAQCEGLLFSGDGEGENIKVAFACKVTITLDVAAQKISILVKEVTIPEAEEELTYIIVGNFSDNNWNTSTAKDKYTFKKVESESNKYSLTVDIAQNVSWKITVLASEGGYDKFEMNAGASRTVTAGSGVTGSVTGLFTGSGGANIGTTANCNVTITIDVVAKTMNIVVNTMEAAAANDERWCITGSTGALGSWSAAYAESRELKADAEGPANLLKITLTFTANTQFKFKQVYTWDTNINYANGGLTVTSEDGIDTTGLFVNAGGTDNNFKVTKACTVTITLNTTTNRISIHVTSL